MSDSPPLCALCRQSSPTMSQSSAWKNCLIFFESALVGSFSFSAFFSVP